MTKPNHTIYRRTRYSNHCGGASIEGNCLSFCHYWLECGVLIWFWILLFGFGFGFLIFDGVVVVVVDGRVFPRGSTPATQIIFLLPPIFKFWRGGFSNLNLNELHLDTSESACRIVLLLFLSQIEMARSTTPR